jgi:hypothetical protein
MMCCKREHDHYETKLAMVSHQRKGDRQMTGEKNEERKTQMVEKERSFGKHYSLTFLC